MAISTDDVNQERERILIALLDEVARGLEDIVAGRTMTVQDMREKYQAQRLPGSPTL